MSQSVSSSTVFSSNQCLGDVNQTPITKERAEDILIVWDVLVRTAHKMLQGVHLQGPETSEEIIKKAGEFSIWFDENLDKLGQLTFLDLGKMGIRHLPESICKLTQLKGLKLHGNQLTFLPEAIGQLTQLNYLNLDHNPLESLPESITQLKLRAIGLEGIQPVVIPDSVKSIPKLNQVIFNPGAWGMHQQGGKISGKKLLVLTAKDATSTKTFEIPISATRKLVCTTYYYDKSSNSNSDEVAAGADAE